jgi:hypothetical protein
MKIDVNSLPSLNLEQNKKNKFLFTPSSNKKGNYQNKYMYKTKQNKKL